MPDNGGFDPAVRRRIAESLSHMFKHMMWAFDLAEMRKNDYKNFVPADRYRFARMLGVVPSGMHHIQFDIFARDGPNQGEKVGVWKGSLEQLSWRQGDQRKIPNAIQCYLLVEEIFGEDEVERRVDALRLTRLAARECLADESVALAARYQRALTLSQRMA